MSNNIFGDYNVSAVTYCIQHCYHTVYNQKLHLTGIVVYAPALALSTVTGLSYLGSVFAVGCVCTFYSTLGGMKAVLVTDVFQSLLMFAAVFAVVIAGTMQVSMNLVISCNNKFDWDRPMIIRI